METAKNAKQWRDYAKRVQNLEAQHGLTTSDAQGVVDKDDMDGDNFANKDRQCPQCGRYVSEDGYYHTRTGDPPVDIYCDQHCADKGEHNGI
jgi:hypothetical protein